MRFRITYKLCKTSCVVRVLWYVLLDILGSKLSAIRNQIRYVTLQARTAYKLDT